MAHVGKFGELAGLKSERILSFPFVVRHDFEAEDTLDILQPIDAPNLRLL